MLLLPFLATAALLHPAPVRLLAAFVLILSLFLVREPLIILARQWWIWRTPHEEARAAARAVPILLAVASASAWAAIPRHLWNLAAACGAASAALMATSITLAIRNRQHSVAFQALGSVGLAASCLAAALAAGDVPRWVWILWAASALHGISAIPIVHARIALRRKQTPRLALAGLGVLATFVAAAAALPHPLSAALAFSGLAHFGEWLALRSPAAAQARLTQLGLRLMATSILFTALLAWTITTV